eukprot:2301576-Amphidinium_carterae.1
MDLACPNLPGFREHYNSHYICCCCGARDLVNLPYENRRLEACWFHGCKHLMCRSCCKEVGFYNTGGADILWCHCHDHELLPNQPDVITPDSDGDYDPDRPDEIRWNASERRRRANQLRPLPTVGPRKFPRQKR